jgi:hypothetical protein
VSAVAGQDFQLAQGRLSFAANQTTTSFPVTIVDDKRPEGGERISLSLGEPADALARADFTLPPDSFLVIDPSDQQPDALVSSRSGSQFVGDNVYNATGAHQSKTLTARRGRTRTFYVRVANDGNLTNTFSVTGSAAQGARMRYFSGLTNITSSMRSRTGWRVTLPPGGTSLVRVVITVAKTAKPGSLKVAAVTARWTGDGVRVDRTRAVLKVAR